VISAGPLVMTIVPEADTLKVEAKVPPQDIDSLRSDKPQSCGSRPSTSRRRRN
jgi:hypothetical protein